MGGCCSKAEEEEEEPQFQLKNMYFDRDGNLRCGHISSDKDEELRLITLGDANSTKLKEEDGSEWFVIDSNWYNAWLAFVHTDRNISPHPGPCRNDRLIMYDSQVKKWVARPSLVMTTKSTRGSYSLVSYLLWEMFRERYPGSGPEIRYTYRAKNASSNVDDHHSFSSLSDVKNNDEVLYVPHYWVIDQEECPEQERVSTRDEDGNDQEVNKIMIQQERPSQVTKNDYEKVYHQEERSYTPSSVTTEVITEDNDSLSHPPRPSKNTKEYEHMTDKNITSEDHKNILSFFGTMGEDLDYHIGNNEIISEKYDHGLGVPEEKTQQDIEPDDWLFGKGPDEL